MYADDIRKMSDEQILDSIEDQKEALFNLRFQEASGQLEDVNALKRTRRDLARLQTILRERQLAAERVQQEGNK
jgi:large subunit ribosomal protein L29